MSAADRVLLLELRERTSAAGNRYLSGWLGKASVVAFIDREAEGTVWQVFVSAPTPKGERPSGSAASPASTGSPFMPRARQPRRRGAASMPPGELDDDLSDL